jgi:hypothetical protein
MAKKKTIKDPALMSWVSLNEALRDADLKRCTVLLSTEKNGRKRKQFLKRIHSRLNKVRADVERAELA